MNIMQQGLRCILVICFCRNASVMAEWELRCAKLPTDFRIYYCMSLLMTFAVYVQLVQDCCMTLISFTFYLLYLCIAVIGEVC